MELHFLFLLIFLFNLGCAASEISLRFVCSAVSKGVSLMIDLSWSPWEMADQLDSNYKLGFICSAVSKGVSLMIDLSWSPWEMADQLASEAGVPVVRSLLGSQQMVAAIDSYLESRNATDAAILLESEMDSARALKAMRPEPSFHVLVGDSGALETSSLALPTVLLQLDAVECCKLIGARDDCECPSDVQTSSLALLTVLLQLDAVECCKLIGARDDCECPSDVQTSSLALPTVLLQLDAVECCKLIGARDDCKCPSDVQTSSLALLTVLLQLDAVECCKLIGARDDCECPLDVQ
ncbi:Ionotropic receptor, partial [Operophtera brumata]